MGQHYLQIGYDTSAPCNDIAPLHVLYNEGRVNGWVFMHLAKLDGPRFEHPPLAAINGILTGTPDCVGDDMAERGLSTMHVWLDKYIVGC